MRGGFLQMLLLQLSILPMRGIGELTNPPSPHCTEHERAGTCVGVAGLSLTIPCGPYAKESGVKFTYSQLAQGTAVFTRLVRQQTSFLVLTVTRKDHNSLVKCTTNTSTAEVIYRLNITYPPQEKPLVVSPNVILGEPLDVTCPIEANPPASYYWLAFTNIDRAVRRELPSELEYLSPDNKTWHVREWTTEYNGYYVCCARNSLGEACYYNITNFYLGANRCETIARRKGSIVSVTESNERDGRTAFPPRTRVILRCSFANLARMNQPPYWFHEVAPGTYRSPHELRNEYKIVSQFDSVFCVWTSWLTIKSLNQSQIGVYICSHNTASVNKTLTLPACYTNTQENYQVQVTRQNRTRHLEGSHVTVTCWVNRANPEHHPRWCRSSGETCVGVENKAGVYQNLTSFISSNCTWLSQLEIPSFSAKTSGEYKCFIPGTSLSQNVSLDLQEIVEVNVAGISAGSVVAVLVVSAIISITGIFIATHRARVLPYAQAKEPPEEGFKWDVFLSCHREAEEFVITHIKMLLESHQPCYRVCWHHVDFLPGRTILDNINEAVEKSRKVVFVFSSGFPQSEYCMAELLRTLDRLQRTRTRCMVPIVLDEEGVPSELKNWVTYWPVVKAEADFAKKLISHLGPPCKHPTISRPLQTAVKS